MRSTFMGLEASKKGLFVQQSALYTTGHNISNANTEGYSRQRVNMSATPGYPHPGLNSPTYPGHMGTGVEATSIQRIRDEFIDRQYRQESNKLGYWESTIQSINQMEDILSEPSEFGINQSFTDFWKSLQDIAANPEDAAARKVAVSKAEALADSFNYNYTQLQQIQGNIGNEINVTTKNINSILKKIAAVNEQIMAMEPNGYVMNDLYDARDVLIDELNDYLPVSTARVPSGGKASEVAEGSLTVYFKDGTGSNVILVHGKEHVNIAVNDGEGGINGAEPHEPFVNMTVSWVGEEPPEEDIFQNYNIENALVPDGHEVPYTSFEPSKGKLVALIDAYGHTEPDRNGSLGIYPDMLAELDKLASAFVAAFNEKHGEGNPLPGADTVGEFFEIDGDSAAKGMRVKQEIIDNPSSIGASKADNEEGNGKHATDLANLQFVPQGDLEEATFQGYYQGMIGDMAVKGQEAKRLEYNSGTLLLTIENSRSSMSSVSLDEEMTNMITFQQAYNANARMITVVDETLDKIINGMGRVGL